MEEPCQNSGVPQSLAPVLYYRRTDILLWMWLILSSNSVPEGVYFDLMGAASGQQTVESQDWSDVRVRTLNKNEGIPHPRTEDPHKSPPPPPMLLALGCPGQSCEVEEPPSVSLECPTCAKRENPGLNRSHNKNPDCSIGITLPAQGVKQSPILFWALGGHRRAITDSTCAISGRKSPWSEGGSPSSAKGGVWP